MIAACLSLTYLYICIMCVYIYIFLNGDLYFDSENDDACWPEVQVHRFK